MSFKAFPFTFAKPAGTTGTQVVVPGGGSGIPFEPKAFMFMSAGWTASGVFSKGPPGPGTARRWYMMGMAVPPGAGARHLTGFGGSASTIEQVLRSTFSEAGAYGGFYDEEHCLGFHDNLGAFGTARVSSKGKIQSVDDLGGGFFGLTLNWPNNEGAPNTDPARLIHGVAFGGDDVTVALCHWAVSSVVGAGFAALGVGFQPDLVLTIGGDASTGPSSTGPGYHMHLSAFNCLLEQCGTSVAPSNGGGQAVGVREHSTVSAIPVLSDETHTAFNTITAMVSDGWEFETTGPGLAGAYGYGLHSLVFKNVASKIGSFVKPVSTTGPQSVPTPSMTPVLAWLFGSNNTAVAGLQNNDRIASGFATGAGQVAAAWSSIRTPGTTPMSGVGYSDKAFAVVDNDTESVQSRIASVGFAVDEIIPDWDISDAVQTEVLFAALGEGDAGACPNTDMELPAEDLTAAADMTLTLVGSGTGDDIIISPPPLEDDEEEEEGPPDDLSPFPADGSCCIQAGIDFWPDLATQRNVVRVKGCDGGAGGSIWKDDGTGHDWVIIKAGLEEGIAPNFTIGGAEASGRVRKCFLADGINPVQVLTGDNNFTTDLAVPPADWTGNYQPMQIVIHEGYAFGFGNANDPHRIYRSKQGDHEDYTSVPYSISVFPGVGERLVAGCSYKGLLMVWKFPEGCFAIDTTDPDDTKWKTLKVGVVGVSGPGNVCAIADDIIYVSPDGGWHLISATQVTGFVRASDLSFRILGFWAADHINIRRLVTAQLVYYDLKQEIIMVCHAAGAGECDKSRRIHLDIGRRQEYGERWIWWDRDNNEAIWIRKEDGILLKPVIGDNRCQVWQIDQRERLRDGEPFEAEWFLHDKDIGDLVPGWSGRRKNVRFVQLEWDERSPGQHRVDVLRDGVVRQTIDFGVSGGGGPILPFTLPVILGGATLVVSRRRRLYGTCNRLAFKGLSLFDASLVRMFIGVELGD